MPDSTEANHEDYNRVLFHALEDFANDERWEDRPIRVPPGVRSWSEGPPARGLTLSYYEDWQLAPNFGRGLQKSNLAQLVLRDHGYERAERFAEGTWSIWWCSGDVQPADLASLHSWQRVNKFPGATALTSKLQLWRHFAAMQQMHGRAAFNYVPDTYILPESLAAFETQLTEGGPDEVWILKPDNETGRLRASSNGSGIFLHRAPSNPLSRASGEGGESTVLNAAVWQHRGVACRYIERPLLIDGRKFDVRLYVLVTSFHPLVAYLYEEGLGRFASVPYDANGALEERTMHLTNYSLNKHASGFEIGDDAASGGTSGCKWSLRACKRRLREMLGTDDARRVWRSVDEVIVKTLISVEVPISKALEVHLPACSRGEHNRQCFHLFGFDVLIDATLKPWLLEVLTYLLTYLLTATLMDMYTYILTYLPTYLLTATLMDTDSDLYQL